MGIFRNRPLPVLDRIYGFLSGKTSPPEVNTDAPLTLVHNVAREAELGSAYGRNGGYGVQNMTEAYAALSNDRQQQDAYSYLLAGFDPQLDPKELDVAIWLLDMTYTSTVPADMDDACVTLVNFGTLTPCILETTRILGVYNATNYSEASNYLALGDIYVHHPLVRVQWPILVHRGERLLLRMNGGGAGTANIYFHFWVGRKGTTPPGMS